MKKKTVYVSHPSSGLEENTKKIEQIIQELYSSDYMFENYVFISPVHNFGFMYHNTEYNRGITYCTDLLEHCDIMLLCGEWENSKGCNIELAKCRELNIPVVEARSIENIRDMIAKHEISV